MTAIQNQVGTLPSIPPKENSTALDQWRGLALILVLISHGFYWTARVNGAGRIGVNLFFFISGILVFRSLSGSSRKSEFRRGLSFWKRRLLRLYPAMIAFLVAMIPLVYFFQGRPGLPRDSDLNNYLLELPYAVFYWIDNGTRPCPISLGHLWSVCVEMQFYLLAPLIFFAGGNSEVKRLLVWLPVLILLMSLGVSEVFRGYHEKYQFQVTVWPMMLGFCMEYKKGWAQLIPKKLAFVAIRLGQLVLLAALTLMILGVGKGLVIAAGATVFIPCFLCYTLNRAAKGVLGRSLQWLGERTYSIYLWQQPLTLCGYFPPLLHPLGAVLSAGVGGLWYHVFERPFLSSKRREVSDQSAGLGKALF